MRKPWGNTREEFQALYDLDKSKHREQERGPTTRDIKSSLFGIDCLQADIQAANKPWPQHWVHIQPHLRCGIHIVLIAKQWSKRIEKLTSPLLPQVP
jgi:hypothetical protein